MKKLGYSLNSKIMRKAQFYYNLFSDMEWQIWGYSNFPLSPTPRSKFRQILQHSITGQLTTDQMVTGFSLNNRPKAAENMLIVSEISYFILS